MTYAFSPVVILMLRVGNRCKRRPRDVLVATDAQGPRASNGCAAVEHCDTGVPKDAEVFEPDGDLGCAHRRGWKSSNSQSPWRVRGIQRVSNKVSQTVDLQTLLGKRKPFTYQMEREALKEVNSYQCRRNAGHPFRSNRPPNSKPHFASPLHISSKVHFT